MVPLLLTCLAVGFACMHINMVSWIIGNKSPQPPPNPNVLLSTSSSAPVWWSLFKQPKRKKRITNHFAKEAKLHRALSSIGRFALRSQTKQNPSIISFFVALSNEKGKKELDLNEFGQLIEERVVTKHERFRSRICWNDDRYFEVSSALYQYARLCCRSPKFSR